LAFCASRFFGRGDSGRGRTQVQTADRFSQVAGDLQPPPRRRGQQRIAARLSTTCSVGVVHVPDRAQPDQLPPEVIQRLLESPE
ncbi:MAG TPA: hypothetical protein VI756_10500, partial [Blastocatellia bacterium]